MYRRRRRRERRVIEPVVALAAVLSLVVIVAFFLARGGGDAGPRQDSAAVAPTVGDDGTPTVVPTQAPTATPVPADAIVIGSLLAETGVMASVEGPLLAAVQAQIERIGAQGVSGRPVLLVHADSQSRQSVLHDQTLRLTRAGARVLIVGCEQEFLTAVIEALDSAGAEVLLLSPCGADRAWDQGELGDLAFSFAIPATLEGQVMAERARSVGATRAALLVDTSGGVPDQQCEGFARRWRELGGTLTAELRLTFADASVLGADPGGLEARLAGPDVIALCADPLAGVPMLTGLRRAGVGTPVIAASTMAGGWSLAEAGDVGRLEVVAYASIAGDDPSAAVVGLVQAYFETKQRLPESGRLVTGADVVDAYTRAVIVAGTTDPAAVAAVLEGFDGEQLVSGPLTFEAGRRTATGRTMRILTVSDMQFVFVESRTPGEVQ